MSPPSIAHEIQFRGLEEWGGVWPGFGRQIHQRSSSVPRGEGAEQLSCSFLRPRPPRRRRAALPEVGAGEWRRNGEWC